MMEKVKITKQQTDAIVGLLKTISRDGLLNHHSKISESSGMYWLLLKELSTADLAKALYIGYEVETEFKDNEWVVLNDGTVTQILYVKGYVFPHEFEKCFAHERGGDNWYDYKTIDRHATSEEIKVEQERRVWVGIGREVNEWKWGDVLVLSNGKEFRILSDRCEAFADGYYDAGRITKLYPAESCISFGGEKK